MSFWFPVESQLSLSSHAEPGSPHLAAGLHSSATSGPTQQLKACLSCHSRGTTGSITPSARFCQDFNIPAYHKSACEDPLAGVSLEVDPRLRSSKLPSALLCSGLGSAISQGKVFTATQRPNDPSDTLSVQAISSERLYSEVDSGFLSFEQPFSLLCSGRGSATSCEKALTIDFSAPDGLPAASACVDSLDGCLPKVDPGHDLSQHFPVSSAVDQEHAASFGPGPRTRQQATGQLSPAYARVDPLEGCFPKVDPGRAPMPVHSSSIGPCRNPATNVSAEPLEDTPQVPVHRYFVRWATGTSDVPSRHDALSSHQQPQDPTFDQDELDVNRLDAPTPDQEAVLVSSTASEHGPTQSMATIFDISQHVRFVTYPQHADISTVVAHVLLSSEYLGSPVAFRLLHHTLPQLTDMQFVVWAEPNAGHRVMPFKIGSGPLDICTVNAQLKPLHMR